MPRLDPHSQHDSDQPQTESFDLRLRVDFERHVLEGEVSLRLAASAARQRGGAFDLDTRELGIESVTTSAGHALVFELGSEDPVLGARLRLTLPPDTEWLTIRYRTSARATALGWLAPEQTAGRRHPYLYSQCQAIHARSIVPLQDTPRRRVTFSATLDVPAELTSLMAARFIERQPGAAGRALDRWEMPQAIPPYLLALAVGKLTSREISPRVRVWAEPEVIDVAAREFDGVEPMIAAAERLFGPYDWERFDLLVMPPAFPYGGMENPRLTFLTPTIIAGDRSLVNVVAHELSHSWTGNLVSNASAEHFWLNEGFTVYAERRILEAIWGREEAELHAAVGRQELLRVLEELAPYPALTRLRGHLSGIDPDHAFSIVPYEKGYLLLRAIEEAVGRERWDRFVLDYMRAYRFQALTTEEWLVFLERELPGAAERVDAAAYLHAPGLPASAPVPRSERLARVLALPPGVPDAHVGGRLTPLEWRLYLDHMPRPTPAAACAALDARFALSASKNAEILSGWLELALESGYAPAVPRAIGFLGEVGRMKYLKPLYKALVASLDTSTLAREAYARHRDGYHPIAQHVVESLFAAELAAAGLAATGLAATGLAATGLAATGLAATGLAAADGEVTPLL
jgi:leukotriene-A4 hydrolase